MNKPNILLINCDDLGYGDLSCYGSTLNKSPAIDRLASEGMKFNDFYMASPVCSASRAGMMTGCYSQRIGFGNYQVLFPGNDVGLHPNENTLASMLKENGYATKLVGKWHCGDQPEFLPTSHGFDEYFGIPFSNDMGRSVRNMKGKPLPLMRNNEVIQQQPDQRGLTERYVDECLQFMRDHDSEPFFLYLAHMYVHVPLFVPRQFLDVSENGAYGGAVACIDWAWAMLDAELERLDLKENTIVIFTSDNGSRVMDEGGSNGVLRGTKAQTWEGGQRVPCIVRWPGNIPAGTECNGIASAIDFKATLAELTGTEIKEDLPLDSISLAKTLTEEAESARESFAYYRSVNLEAVRKGDWKLHFCKIGWSPGGMEDEVISELYNLKEDPGEQNNVIADHPQIVEELEALAAEYREQLGDERLGIEGKGIREIGHCEDAKPLTQYDESHPYMIAYYDLADMPTMSG